MVVRSKKICSVFATVIVVATLASAEVKQESNITGAPTEIRESQLRSIEEDCECAVPHVDHLILWQSSGSRSALRKVNDHNKQFLPEGSEIHWVDNNGMLAHVWHVSHVLAKCRNITGLYEAFVMLRPLAYRADVFRNAVLWHYGGLWMDHKVVLTSHLSTAIDFQSNEVVLPVDNKGIDNSFSRWALTRQVPVHNAILFSRLPRHIFFEYILRLQIQNVQERFYGSSRLEVTGPCAYSVALQYYLGNVSLPSINRSISGGFGNHINRASVRESSTGDMMLHDGTTFSYRGVYRKTNPSEGTNYKSNLIH